MSGVTLARCALLGVFAIGLSCNSGAATAPHAALAQRRAALTSADLGLEPIPAASCPGFEQVSYAGWYTAPSQSEPPAWPADETQAPELVVTSSGTELESETFNAD